MSRDQKGVTEQNTQCRHLGNSKCKGPEAQHVPCLKEPAREADMPITQHNKGFCRKKHRKPLREREAP